MLVITPWWRECGPQSLWGADVGQDMLGRPSRAPVPDQRFWPWLVRVVRRDMASVYTAFMANSSKINGAEISVIISAAMTIPTYNCLLYCVSDVKNTKYAP